MVKANLTLLDGTKVKIDGPEEEVASLLAKLSQPVGKKKKKKKKKDTAAYRPTRSKGPIGYITELVDEGFFKTKQTLQQIQSKLEEKGHIYATTSLSPALVRLVRKRVLRRIKEKKVWVYVKS